MPLAEPRGVCGAGGGTTPNCRPDRIARKAQQNGFELFPGCARRLQRCLDVHGQAKSSPWCSQQQETNTWSQRNTPGFQLEREAQRFVALLSYQNVYINRKQALGGE